MRHFAARIKKAISSLGAQRFPPEKCFWTDPFGRISLLVEQPPSNDARQLLWICMRSRYHACARGKLTYCSKGLQRTYSKATTVTETQQKQRQQPQPRVTAYKSSCVSRPFSHARESRDGDGDTDLLNLRPTQTRDRFLEIESPIFLRQCLNSESEKLVSVLAISFFRGRRGRILMRNTIKANRDRAYV